MSAGGATPPRYFDTLYAGNADPWHFATSRYEREKYRTTLAALPRRRFRAGLEAGCSIGVFTRMLAGRCARLLAVDVAEAALAQARRRCLGARHVRFLRAVLPAAWPVGRFDLILLSEVLYFLGPARIRRLARRVPAALVAGGVVMLVNFLGRTGTACDGDAAARLFIAHARRLHPIRQLRRPGYRLDLLAG